MTSKPAKVEARYVGDCRSCGRRIDLAILVQSTAAGDGEWVRCGECRSINRVPIKSTEGMV